jgi:hypothetical protein
MVKKMLLLTMLSFSLAIGSFWVLRAQDPTTPKPDPAAPKQDPAMPKTETTKTQPQTTAKMTQQVDLSGTYAGTFNCEEAGLMGDTTLTITGNEFTTADGRTGRLTASKTSGYTAVALQVSPADSTAGTATAKVISLRAKKSGNKLTLTPVSGSNMKCSFAPSKTMAKTTTKKGTPAATGTEVANPTAMPAQTPSPTPSPSPSPEASPTPMPTPGGSPRPTPMPSPSPGEPTPSPTPSPSPSPRIG